MTRGDVIVLAVGAGAAALIAGYMAALVKERRRNVRHR